MRNPQTSDSVAYNYPVALSIRGPLDRGSLQKSLDQIVARHETFRSLFRVDGNALTQVVLKPRPLAISEIDLSATAPGARLSRAVSLAAEAARRSFDLSAGMLLRPLLIRIAADHSILLLVTHHIVCDDWSVAVLLRELAFFYAAYSSPLSAPASLDPLPAPYSRIACDLVRCLNDDEADVQTRFWERRLRHRSDFHHVQPDFPRLQARSFRSGARVIRLLPPDLSRAARQLAQVERVSPFMVLLAAFDCLLCRYSGEEDVGIATCAANRSSTQLEPLIAPLSNRVVLRVDLSGNPRFNELLARVRDAALNAYSNQSTPFGAIVEKMSPEVRPSRNPLFQTLLVLQDAPQESWDLGGSEASLFSLETGTTRYDLNVWLRFKSDDSLEADFQYDSGLFRASTVRALLDDFCNIFETFIANPAKRLHAPLDSERREALSIASVESAPSSSSTPEDEMENRLAKIWQELLGLKVQDTNMDFFEAGGDSLRVAQLFARIEKVFSIQLPVSTILEARTCRTLARLLRSRRPASAASSVVAVKPSGSRPPVFCIHSHSGDVLFCRSFPKYLRAGHPLYGLQSLTLSGKASQFSVKQMAASYVEELLRLHPQGPCFLFGYSFGGLIAFEMSHLLLARGRNVAFLGMFNTPAPGSLEGWPLRQASYLRGRMRNELGKLPTLGAKERLAHLARNASNFPRMMLRSAIVDTWRFSAPFFGKRLMERSGRALLTLDQINIAAAKSYVPEHVFPGRISFFQAEAIPYLYAISPQIGWAPFAVDGIEIVNVSAEPGQSTWEQFGKTVMEQLNVRLEQLA